MRHACWDCDREFPLGTHPNTRRCGPCKAAHDRAGFVRYNRLRSAAVVAARKDRTCTDCAALLPPEANGNTLRCSSCKRAKKREWNQKTKAKQLAVKARVPCALPGCDELTPTMFCSDVCRNAWRSREAKNRPPPVRATGPVSTHPGVDPNRRRYDAAADLRREATGNPPLPSDPMEALRVMCARIPEFGIALVEVTENPTAARWGYA